jgi:hypothetical protein
MCHSRSRCPTPSCISAQVVATGEVLRNCEYCFFPEAHNTRQVAPDPQDQAQERRPRKRCISLQGSECFNICMQGTPQCQTQTATTTSATAQVKRGNRGAWKPPGALPKRLMSCTTYQASTMCFWAFLAPCIGSLHSMFHSVFSALLLSIQVNV